MFIFSSLFLAHACEHSLLMIGINILHADNPGAFTDIFRQHDTQTPPPVKDFFSQSTSSGVMPLLYAECILPYPAYPIKVYHGDQFQWLLEGCIYNYTPQEIQSGLDQCFTEAVPDIRNCNYLPYHFPVNS